MSNQLFDGVASLNNIATELVDQITSYLETQDQHSMLLASRYFHDATSRQLYRHVQITDTKSPIFFKTIAESSKNYGRHTISLHYLTSCFSDMRCSYILLCYALPYLGNVRRLTLQIRPQLSSFLVHLLKRRYFVFPQDWENAQAYMDVYELSGIPHPKDNGFYNLGKLNTLNLYGDMKLLTIINTDTLTTLRINLLVDVDDANVLLSVCAPSGSNHRIIELALSLHGTLGARIGSMVYCIAEAFPNIEHLSLRSHSINALEASQILTYSPPLMANISTFQINDWSVVAPMYFFLRSDALKLQEEHILAAKKTHPHLKSLRFGPNGWTYDPVTGNWQVGEAEPTELEGIENNLDRTDDRHDLMMTDYPLFWDVDYRLPPLLSSLNTELLSSSTEPADDTDEE